MESLGFAKVRFGDGQGLARAGIKARFSGMTKKRGNGSSPPEDIIFEFSLEGEGKPWRRRSLS
ncbi:MAG: hypothetical protein OXG62_12905, partial [Nitrospinae bacterium]|nr:hypothetical protein [Nitrospinota bacterium]